MAQSARRERRWWGERFWAVMESIGVARRLGYISQAEFVELDVEVQRVFAPLSGLLRRTKETG